MTSEGPFQKLKEFIELNYYQAEVTFTNTLPSEDHQSIEYQVYFRTPSPRKVEEDEKKVKKIKDDTK